MQKTIIIIGVLIISVLSCQDKGLQNHNKDMKSFNGVRLRGKVVTLNGYPSITVYHTESVSVNLELYSSPSDVFGDVNNDQIMVDNWVDLKEYNKDYIPEIESLFNGGSEPRRNLLNLIDSSEGKFISTCYYNEYLCESQASTKNFTAVAVLDTIEKKLYTLVVPQLYF